MHRRLSIAVVAALVVALAGCGGDDTAAGATMTTASDGATAETAAGTTGATPASTTGGTAEASGELCALVTELFELEGFPSVDQLQRYQQLAPEPIADAVNEVTEPLITSGGDLVESFKVLADDDIEAAIAEIDAFEEETCGIPHSEEAALPEGSTREIEQGAVRVDVSATDYAFHIGDVASGRTSFVLTNDGDETHEMVVVKLAAGVTLDEAIQADGEEGTVDSEWGTNFAAPGGDEEAVTFDVEPGNYALVCFMPDADGTPHMVLGMRHEFTVS